MAAHDLCVSRGRIGHMLILTLVYFYTDVARWLKWDPLDTWLISDHIVHCLVPSSSFNESDGSNQRRLIIQSELKPTLETVKEQRQGSSIYQQPIWEELGHRKRPQCSAAPKNGKNGLLLYVHSGIYIPIPVVVLCFLIFIYRMY